MVRQWYWSYCEHFHAVQMHRQQDGGQICFTTFDLFSHLFAWDKNEEMHQTLSITDQMGPCFTII